jgi:hypothetical protein
MVRKQVFIREDQQEKLKSIAARDGVAEAELVREGLDLVLERKKVAEVEDDSWKEAFRQAAGMWKDRDDLDAFYAANRKRRAERRQRMNALIAKAFE